MFRVDKANRDVHGNSPPEMGETKTEIIAQCISPMVRSITLSAFETFSELALHKLTY